MTKLLRWTGYGLGGILALILLAVGCVWLLSESTLNASATAKPEHLAQATADQLADADRRAHVLGCFSCHGEGLRGSKMFDQPNVGTIWAPNLTRVAAHASDQQLAAAIRQGVSDEREALFIMPSEAFQHLSDQEVAALVAMIRALPRGGSDVPHNVYGPIGRLGIVLGKFKTAPALVAEYSAQEPISLGPQYDAGHRLAILYCSACHNADLSGKEVKPGDISPDLTIAGAYDLPAFKRLLRTGVPAGGQRLNMMGPTARSDLSHMTDGEIDQLYAYLQARAQRLSR